MTDGAGSTEYTGLALSDFDGLVGTSFAIQTEVGEQELVLRVAQEIPGALRPGGGFRLEFYGPSAPQLPQSIYAFPVGEALHEIFVVPIGAAPDRSLRYEAVFF